MVPMKPEERKVRVAWQRLDNMCTGRTNSAKCVTTMPMHHNQPRACTGWYDFHCAAFSKQLGLYRRTWCRWSENYKLSVLSGSGWKKHAPSHKHCAVCTNNADTLPVNRYPLLGKPNELLIETRPSTHSERTKKLKRLLLTFFTTYHFLLFSTTFTTFYGFRYRIDKSLLQ